MTDRKWLTNNRYLYPWFFTLELVFVIFSINTYGCPGLFFLIHPHHHQHVYWPGSFHGGSSCCSGGEVDSTPSTAGKGGVIAIMTRTKTTNIGIVPNGGGGGDDGDRVLSLTQEVEDCRSELRVTPRESGRLRRGGGPLAASRR